MLTNLRHNRRELPRDRPPLQPLLVTGYLWRLLKRPLRWHPLFARQVQRDPDRFSARPGKRLLMIEGGLFVLWLIAVFLFPQTVFPLTMIALGALPLLLVVFNGTLLGTLWAIDIGGGIASEHTQGRYDLLSMTPRGALGVSWLIATARLHRRDWLNLSHRVVRSLLLLIVPFLLVIIVIGAAVLVFGASGQSNGIPLTRSILNVLIPMATVITLFWLDNIQSALLACLPGLLIPSYLRERTQVQMLCGAAFLTLQVTSYALVVGLVVLWQHILQAFSADETLVLLLLCAGGIGIFYLVREALIGLLWRQLLRRFHADAGEFYLLARL